MTVRVVGAGVVALVLTLGVVSASSLGSLTDVAAWATARDHEACHVEDPATDVEFQDGLLGSLTSVLLSDLVLIDVDYVSLTDLAGNCDGMRPVVIVLGDHDGSTSTPDEVLARTLLPALTGTANETLTITDDVELDALIGQLTITPNSVRIGFCPSSNTTCEP